MKFVDKKILDVGDMAASINSDAVLIDQIYGYAVQCVFTGSPVGTLKIQTSCDILQGTEVVSTWTDLAGATFAVSAAGNASFNYDAQYYQYFRVVYTRTSGTGALSITYNGKG